MAEAASVTNAEIPHTSISELIEECHGRRKSPTYRAKMLHPIPSVPVLEDRKPFIADLCEGHTVLDVGSSGTLSAMIREKATKVFTLDIDPDVQPDAVLDFDDVTASIPKFEGVTRIICSEILEHLGNPGHLLKRLHETYPSTPIIVSAPNAFSKAANTHILRGIENVNRDHVAWYSPKTLEWLLARYGYRMRQWVWYGGTSPYTAEGMIMLAE